MTRDEFTRYQATIHNTEGYTQRQLDAINARVFTAVEHLDAADTLTKSAVDHEFERAFNDDSALWLAGTDGTRLTDDERRVAIAAAHAELAGAKPAIAHAEMLYVLDNGTQEEIDGCAWQRAERAAIAAATTGWDRTPEDLALELA